MVDDQLRDRIAEALMRWADGNHNSAYASLRRPETVTANARGRAEAVLAVVQPELDQLRTHVEELQEKLLSFDDNGKCCCSFDGPGDVCLVHSPMVTRLRAERDAARAQVAAAHDWADELAQNSPLGIHGHGVAHSLRSRMALADPTTT